MLEDTSSEFVPVLNLVWAEPSRAENVLITSLKNIYNIVRNKHPCSFSLECDLFNKTKIYPWGRTGPDQQ